MFHGKVTLHCINYLSTFDYATAVCKQYSLPGKELLPPFQSLYFYFFCWHIIVSCIGYDTTTTTTTITSGTNNNNGTRRLVTRSCKKNSGIQCSGHQGLFKVFEDRPLLQRCIVPA